MSNHGKKRPGSIRSYIEQAGKLLSLGKSLEALPIIEKALRIEPTSLEANHMLGFCHLQSGNPGGGIAALERALLLAPANAGLLNHLGAALCQVNRRQEGIVHLKKAVALAPALGDARNNLAHALNAAGEYAASAHEYRAVIALVPQMIPAWQGLISALHKSGDFTAAVAAAKEATARFPGHSVFVAGLGRIMIDLRQMDAAEKILRQALSLDPANGEAASDLGTIVEQKGNYQEAIALYKIATECKPNLADGWFNLGIASEKAGDLMTAGKALQQCLAIRPASLKTLSALIGVRRKLCDWDGLDEQVEHLRTAINQSQFFTETDDIPSPFVVLSLMLGPEEHLRVAEMHSKTIAKKALSFAAEVGAWQPKPAIDHRLRIGYLSPDFREHPIAQLMAGVIETHDREKFEVSCWSLGINDNSPYRQRIINGCDRFEDLSSASVVESVQMMRAANLDIVIDLAGYTAHARPELLALRVAPVQVNYLGFPGTMGAAFIDFIVVDPVIAGAEDEQYYSEKIIRLPDCYQANDNQAAIEEIPLHRADHGLPEKGFVFCSFSMNYKIDAAVLNAWAKILQSVPGSVLWLYRTDKPAAENILKEASMRGIEEGRIIFADRMPKARHLARHRLADLFLDTFAYGAHTTASDALWAGLPVLTLRGDTFARRVGASIVKAAMMPELVAGSVDEYIAKAIAIAAHPEKMEGLKAKLKDNLQNCPLFSTRLMAQHLEMVYLKMWGR